MNPKVIRAMCVSKYNDKDTQVWIMDIDTRIFESMNFIEHDGDLYIVQSIISSDSVYLKDHNKCDCIILVAKSEGYKRKFNAKDLTEIMKTNIPNIDVSGRPMTPEYTFLGIRLGETKYERDEKY